jgi:type I restriction enzyme S subunit
VREDWHGSFGAFCAVVRPKEEIHPLYLVHFLGSPEYKDLIRKKALGVNINNLRRGDLEELHIPLAPLPQQRRIVTALELQLGRLDAAVARLHGAKAKLKRYKQAVLKAAFSGKLSGSYQEGQDMPEGWSLATTDDLFQYVTSGSRGWAKYYADEGALFLRITNMDFDTLALDLAPEKIQRVHLKDVREGTRTRVQRGDLLISITGYLGMIALVDEDIEEAYVNQHIALARPYDHFNKQYVGYYLTAEEGGRRQFNLAGKGATKAGLTLQDIKALRVPMAPRAEQDRIVEQIEHLLSAVHTTESTLDAQLVQAGRLRQAVLKRAFEGNLA